MATIDVTSGPAPSSPMVSPHRAHQRSPPMDARLDYFADPSFSKIIKYLMGAGRALKDLPLPAATQELVALRISQINGCAVCIDMHSKDAAAAGESPVRLHLVAAWREATVFTEPERA